MNPHRRHEIRVHQSNGRPPKEHDGRTLSHGEPAEPLLRVLPIRRWIPQDIHSIIDYATVVGTGASYLTAAADGDDAASWASIALGASAIGVSALSDYRLSVAKLIPIRVHESLDYAWGASAIALPFVLGYWKSSPRTALVHVVAGATAILGSLFTDYRSYKRERIRRERSRAEPAAEMAT